MHPLELVGGNAEAGETFVHAEDEFVYVLEGAVRVQLDDELLSLVPGDSVYFRGGVAHRWWAQAPGEHYRLLVVKQGPSGWTS
jgi:quercetin dioxygenase-like cupin family protein